MARENLLRIVPILIAAIAAPVVAIVADLPLWSRIGAAIATLVAIVLAVLWIQLPPSAWRENHGRRFFLVALPLVVAGALLISGAIAPGPPDRRLNEPAMLILVDASSAMNDEVAPRCGSCT
jgi:hypothetical protein